MGRGVSDWATFIRIILNVVADPVSRKHDYVQKYITARQRPSQSPLEFDVYLQSLEDNLAPYSEEHRRQHFLQKLQPWLQTEIQKNEPQPQTRRDMVERAQRLFRTIGEDGPAGAAEKENSANPRRKWDNKRGSRSEPASNITGQPIQPAKPAGAPEQLSERPKYNRSKPEFITCYSCGKKGHYSSNCPERTSKANNSPVAIRQVRAGSAEKD